MCAGNPSRLPKLAAGAFPGVEDSAATYQCSINFRTTLPLRVPRLVFFPLPLTMSTGMPTSARVLRLMPSYDNDDDNI